MARRNRPRRIAPLTTPLELRSCLYCHKEFMPNRSWQKYCCQEHSLTAYLHRKYNVDVMGTPPAADAKPIVIAKLDDMLNMEPPVQDEITEMAIKQIKDPTILTNQPMPATKTLKNLGYGIPELDKDDEEDKK